jgi:hypothetical protein
MIALYHSTFNLVAQIFEGNLGKNGRLRESDDFENNFHALWRPPKEIKKAKDRRTLQKI